MLLFAVPKLNHKAFIYRLTEVTWAGANKSAI